MRKGLQFNWETLSKKELKKIREQKYPQFSQKIKHLIFYIRGVIFMCIDNLSGCNLVTLASLVSISIADGLSAEQISTLGAFFTALGDNLALLSINSGTSNC